MSGQTREQIYPSPARTDLWRIRHALWRAYGPALSISDRTNSTLSVARVNLVEYVHPPLGQSQDIFNIVVLVFACVMVIVIVVSLYAGFICEI